MATTHDSHFIQSHFIPSPDQVNTATDPLSVDVVALYIIGGDGQGEKLSDFVFQDQRQPPENGEDEPVRNTSATAPSSPDQLERGPLPPAPDAKAQPVTDKDAGPRKGPYLRPRRPDRRLSYADRKVNWLADGNGQLFRRAIQPLTMYRIIGVSIDFRRISKLNFAQVSREIGNELRKHYESRPIVFLCHGFAAFYLKDVLEANQELDLRPAIAAIGMFGIDPKHRDISELRNWTANKRCKISPLSLLLKNNCQDDFGKALDSLLEAYFVSVFAFRPDQPEGTKPGEPKAMFSVLDSDPIWSGGGLDQIATFSGLEDAGFRGMCKYIVESVEGHQLLTAARENDLQRITTLIRRGTNIDSINYTSRDYKTALAIAAEAGHIETVEFLSIKDYVSLDHGVDGGTSALHCAVQSIRDLIGEMPQVDINEADEYDFDPARKVLGRLKSGGLPLDDEMKLLRDTVQLHCQVKQLSRTIKVVEILLAAGALPDRGLVNTLRVQNPLEKVVKELLSNPPAVQGPSPRRLKVSTPSEQALKVCCNTPFVVREVFSADEDKKDRYIPVYTDINQVIYQKKSSIQTLQAGNNPASPSDVLSPTTERSGSAITFQNDESPKKTVGPTLMTTDTSGKLKNDTEPEFNIDDEFRRRKENLKDAESRLICRWYHIPLNNVSLPRIELRLIHLFIGMHR
jgi:hypothetical protein